MNEEPYKLNDTERMLILGLGAREREIIEKALTPLRTDTEKVHRQIEERLKLEPGTIGRTYLINTDTWELIPLNADERAAGKRT